MGCGVVEGGEGRGRVRLETDNERTPTTYLCGLVLSFYALDLWS